VERRLPGGTRAQPSFSPTSCSYSLLEAQVMNCAAVSEFLVVLGITHAQAHSQPEALVFSTGACT
jgi:hypothetical protein